MRWGAAPLLAFILIVSIAALGGLETSPASAIEIEPVIWEFAEDYPGAQGDDSALPVRTVYLKTHDGVTWMSAWDQNPAAISGVDRLREWIAYYKDRNVDVIAWFVPKGGDVEGQLAFARAVIDAGVKGLYADVEPFPEFCDMDCWWLAQTFWAQLRAERPEAQLGVIYDPRPWWWGWAGIDAWLAQANVALPMCYWDFFVDQPPWNDPSGCITAARSDLAVLAPGRSLEYVPMLQGDSTPEKVLSAMTAAESVGSTRVSVWRRGIVSPDTWNALSAAFPKAPAPSPPSPPSPLQPPAPPVPPAPSPCLSDGCLLQATDGSLHVIYAGARFPVTDDIRAELGNPTIQPVVSDALAMVPTVPADGTLFKGRGSSQLYEVYRGALLPVTAKRDDGLVHTIPMAALEHFSMVPADGTILREPGKRTAYLIAAGARFPIKAEHYEPLGIAPESVREVCRGGLAHLSGVPPGGAFLLHTSQDSVRTFVRQVGADAGSAPDIERLYRVLRGLAWVKEPLSGGAQSQALPICGATTGLISQE